VGPRSPTQPVSHRRDVRARIRAARSWLVIAKSIEMGRHADTNRG
jgi:hypothetical protein